MVNPKCYIGDGVYLAHDVQAGALILTTENGICAQNTIVLEEEVAIQLLRFLLFFFPHIKDGSRPW